VRRVLFDENMPRKLRRELPAFSIRTAQEEGWSAFKNGELLKRASASFDVLVTIDQRMRYQQNVAGLPLGVVAIEVPDTRIAFLYPLLPELREAIEHVRPGEVLVIRQKPS
jgi:predicted nuclease of predicted toxin-antitoxin system